MYLPGARPRGHRLQATEALAASSLISPNARLAPTLTAIHRRLAHSALPFLPRCFCLSALLPFFASTSASASAPSFAPLPLVHEAFLSAFPSAASPPDRSASPLRSTPLLVVCARPPV
ncbi:hypothetical protein CDD83_7035 [Cordyceps sp. RAO-2017]|nr:hypothetical protein CDD83_7035 [Cordyceps sp. RAO-2017]